MNNHTTDEAIALGTLFVQLAACLTVAFASPGPIMQDAAAALVAGAPFVALAAIGVRQAAKPANG